MIIGIYGTYHNMTLQTSVVEAFQDAGHVAIYFGDTEFNTTSHQDAVIYLGVQGGWKLLQAAEAYGLHGVSLDMAIPSDNWVTVDTAEVTVIGSGSDILTSMTRHFLKTGELVVRGLPEDQFAVLDQEQVADAIVAAFNTSTSKVLLSEVTSFAEFSKALWFSASARCKVLGELGLPSGVAPLREMPEVITSRKAPITVRTHLEGDSRISDIIATVIQRLITAGDGYQDDEVRYHVDEYLISEPRLGIKKTIQSFGENTRARISGRNYNPPGVSLNRELDAFYGI